MTDLYRSFTPDLEIQSRARGGDGRTIVGLAVPWNYPQRIDARLTEQFARGAFAAQTRAPQRIPFARGHLPLGGTLIGRTVVLRDDAAGLYGEWKVSNTPAGEETLELVRDGVLTDLSIGFREGQNRRLPGGVTERITATLREVGIVTEGAYGEQAAVAAVRSLGDTSTRIEKARTILASLPDLPPVVP